MNSALLPAVNPHRAGTRSSHPCDVESSTSDIDMGSRDERRLVGKQPEYEFRDFLRLPDASQRNG